MQRVEVLLGPQGTLYGSGTLGGAIRYLPNRPELEQTSFDFRASTFDLAESDSYRLPQRRVTANVPIGDKLALRVERRFLQRPWVHRQPVSRARGRRVRPRAESRGSGSRGREPLPEERHEHRGHGVEPRRLALAAHGLDRRESFVLLPGHGRRRPHGEPRARVRHRQVPGSQPRARAERAHEQACGARDQRRSRLRDSSRRRRATRRSTRWASATRPTC